MLRPLLILLLLALAVTNLPAQIREVPTGPSDMPSQSADHSSPDTATVYYLHLNGKFPYDQLFRQNDTLTTGFQFYLPTMGHSALFTHLGNAGTPYQSLLHVPEYSEEVYYTPYSYRLYFLTNENLPYYRIYNPYSLLTYMMGPGKEQMLNLSHAQNLARGLTAGIDARIINSLGEYLRQRTNDIAVAGQVQYTTDNDRYTVLGNVRYNNMQWRENGGIAVDSVFYRNLETDRRRIQVRFRDAESWIKESGVFFKQFLYLGKAKKDTAVRHYYRPEMTNFISHSFNYSANSYKFEDKSATSLNYMGMLPDSTYGLDNSRFFTLRNEFAFEGGVGRLKDGEKALQLRAGVAHTFLNYKRDTVKDNSRNYQLLTPFAWASANVFRVAKLEGSVYFTKGTPFDGNKGLNARITFPAYDNLNKWGNLVGSINLETQQPPLRYQHYSGNVFDWENAFGQSTLSSLKVWYMQKYVHAGFNGYNLNNRVYLGPDAFPQVDEGNTQLLQAWAETVIKPGGATIDIFGAWQHVANSELLHLPVFAGRATVYYQLPLFKRALWFQGGLTLHYHTRYKADAYMPALQSFYTQNEVETGGYPYLDLFANVRVKRARMFVMINNLFAGVPGYNYGLLGYEYIYTPGYPMNDPGFRFGLSWAFYD